MISSSYHLVSIILILAGYIIYISRQNNYLHTCRLDALKDLGNAQGRLTLIGVMSDAHLKTVEAQYQARLDQADSRLDDQRAYIAKLEEENKSLLDKCLIRNSYKPIHTQAQPQAPMQPVQAPNQSIPSSVQRAQDNALKRYMAFQEALDNTLLDEQLSDVQPSSPGELNFTPPNPLANLSLNNNGDQ